MERFPVTSGYARRPAPRSLRLKVVAGRGRLIVSIEETREELRNE